MRRALLAATVALALLVAGAMIVLLAGGDSTPSVAAFSARSGKKLWVHSTSFVGGALAYSSGPLVYVTGLTSCGQHRLLIALDPKTGNERWRTPVGDDFTGPSVKRGVLVTDTRRLRQVRGLDAVTGKVVWETPASDAGWEWVEIGDVVIVAQHVSRFTNILEDHATVLDRKSGATKKSVRWFPRPPIAMGDVLITGTQRTPIPPLSEPVPDRTTLRAVSLADGTTKWSAPFGGTVDPDRVVEVAGVLPLRNDAKTAVGFDVASGRELWRITETDKDLWSFGASAPDVLVATWISMGGGTVTRLDPATGRVLWERPYKLSSDNPAVGPNLVIVNEHAYGSDDGRQRWQLPSGVKAQLVTSALVLTTTDFSTTCAG
jgi:outer membrane protein assembly factor BamB